MAEQNEKFIFTYTVQESIEAKDVTEALLAFMKKHPEVGPKDINHVAHKGYYLPYAISKETRERIYYMPGCHEGYDDCIFDPMEEVAASCRHQADMTVDRQVMCKEWDSDDECPHYDDECK